MVCYKCGEVNNLSFKKRGGLMICKDCRKEEYKNRSAHHVITVDPEWLERARESHRRILNKYGGGHES